MSAVLMKSESSSVPALHANWLDAAVVALCVAALGSSLWLGSMLVPNVQAQATEHDRLLTWHAFILQFGVLMAAFAAALVYRMRRLLVAWWAGADAQKRALALCAPIVALEAFFVAGFWLTRDRSVAELGYLRAFFWLGREWNPPAIFSALQLGLVGALAWWCYTAGRARAMSRPAFALVALLCLYMAVDEMLMVHERVGEVVRTALSSSTRRGDTLAFGPLQVYGWILVYGPLALICAAVLGGMLWRQLPADNSFLLLSIAGFVFVGGAVGIETLNSHGMASGWHPRGSAAEHGYVLLEEAMEMVGVTLALFVFARCLLRLRENRWAPPPSLL